MTKDAKKIIMARADMYMIIARQLQDGENVHMNITLEQARKMVDEYLCLMENLRIKDDFYAIEQYNRDSCFYGGYTWYEWKNGKFKEYKNYKEWAREVAA